MTLLTPGAGVFRMAQTCQTRFGSYPQDSFKNASTVARVGEAAVKFEGEGSGNLIGPALGAEGTSCCCATAISGAASGAANNAKRTMSCFREAVRRCIWFPQ